MKPPYLLITPAKNEEAFIEHTIKSVVRQTILPVKWIIISDGSTDRTDNIVQRYAAEYEWIELIRLPLQQERHFASKVRAFNAGYARTLHLDYEIVGNLDADISFEPDYFEFLLKQFEQRPDLGVAGTPFVEEGFQYNYRFVSIEHVSGACQLFRRECFEDIGGYRPIRGGGIDWVAVTSARMKGWRTRSFTERTCLHHRRTGTSKSGILKARLLVGKKDYCLGGHPLWEVFRSLYQMTLKPYLVGGILIFTGYFWAFASRCERSIPQDLINFRRKEQMRQLKKVMLRTLGLGDANWRESRRLH
jgi:biofilm PGA synthesis N-glycosyltransferase PgaC